MTYTLAGGVSSSNRQIDITLWSSTCFLRHQYWHETIKQGLSEKKKTTFIFSWYALSSYDRKREAGKIGTDNNHGALAWYTCCRIYQWLLRVAWSLLLILLLFLHLRRVEDLGGSTPVIRDHFDSFIFDFDWRGFFFIQFFNLELSSAFVGPIKFQLK